MTGLALLAHLAHPGANTPIPAVSTELVRVRVGSAPGPHAGPQQDLHHAPVWVAFTLAPGTPFRGGAALAPQPDEWHTAAWDPSGAVAEVLIGPGGLLLDAGTWAVWVRVDWPPEHVVRNAGTLQIT